MLDFLQKFRPLVDLFDIFIVSFIIYRIILLIKGTRAVQMLLGLVVLLGLYVISQIFGLYTLNWFLSNFLSSIVLVVIVIFQNDIRRALMHVGKNPFFAGLSREESSEIIENIVSACFRMASKRFGALIVIERETGIKDFLEIGTDLDAQITSDLIVSVFLPYSPLHDGALIVQGGRITRAGCFLPLSHNPDLSKNLGTRHRAAVGLTELVDAVTIVVSEETGTVSVVVNGKMTKDLDASGLRKILARLLQYKSKKRRIRK